MGVAIPKPCPNRGPLAGVLLGGNPIPEGGGPNKPPGLLVGGAFDASNPIPAPEVGGPNKPPGLLVGGAFDASNPIPVGGPNKPPGLLVGGAFDASNPIPVPDVGGPNKPPGLLVGGAFDPIPELPEWPEPPRVEPKVSPPAAGVVPMVTAPDDDTGAAVLG